MNGQYGWIIGLLICCLCTILLLCTLWCLDDTEEQKQIDNAINGITEITLAQFLRFRKKRNNFAGCYILHNTTTGWYYVGQSIHVLDRVNQHFTGYGNDAVYYDYAYQNHNFTIKMLPLTNSGFKTLNELERKLIARYNAYYKGYNMTRGNHN